MTPITGLPTGWSNPSTTREWALETGWTVTHHCEGPRASVDGAISALPAGYLTFSIDEEHWSDNDTDPEKSGKATLTVTYAFEGDSGNPDIPGTSDGLISLTWSREWTVEDSSLVDAPNLKALRDYEIVVGDLAGLGWLAAIEEAAKAYRQYRFQWALDEVVGPPTNPYAFFPAAPSGAPLTAEAFEIYRELIRNPDASYVHYRPTLRKNMTLSRAFSASLWTEIVDDVTMTQAQLLVHEPTLTSVPYLYDKLTNWLWKPGRPGISITNMGQFHYQVDYEGVRETNSGVYPAYVAS